MLGENYRYKAFFDAIEAGVLDAGETTALKTAAEEGTTVELLTTWSSSHSDADFRQVCTDTLALMQ